jgi:hypothetical protein
MFIILFEEKFITEQVAIRQLIERLDFELVYSILG